MTTFTSEMWIPNQTPIRLLVTINKFQMFSAILTELTKHNNVVMDDVEVDGKNYLSIKSKITEQGDTRPYNNLAKIYAYLMGTEAATIFVEYGVDDPSKIPAFITNTKTKEEKKEEVKPTVKPVTIKEPTTKPKLIVKTTSKLTPIEQEILDWLRDHVYGTQQDIYDALGYAPVTVSRYLASLKAKCVIVRTVGLKWNAAEGIYRKAKELHGLVQPNKLSYTGASLNGFNVVVDHREGSSGFWSPQDRHCYLYYRFGTDAVSSSDLINCLQSATNNTVFNLMKSTYCVKTKAYKRVDENHILIKKPSDKLLKDYETRRHFFENTETKPEPVVEKPEPQPNKPITKPMVLNSFADLKKVAGTPDPLDPYISRIAHDSHYNMKVSLLRYIDKNPDASAKDMAYDLQIAKGLVIEVCNILADKDGVCIRMRQEDRFGNTYYTYRIDPGAKVTAKAVNM